MIVIVKAIEYLENGLYLILESKVEGLLGKVSDDAGEISAPKTQDAFVVERPTDAISDAGEPLKFEICSVSNPGKGRYLKNAKVHWC